MNRITPTGEVVKWQLLFWIAIKYFYSGYYCMCTVKCIVVKPIVDTYYWLNTPLNVSVPDRHYIVSSPSVFFMIRRHNLVSTVGRPILDLVLPHRPAVASMPAP